MPLMSRRASVPFDSEVRIRGCRRGCELRNRDTRPGQDKEAGAEGNRRTLSPVRGVAQAAAGAAFGTAALRAVAPSGDVLTFTRE
jgi:hypothetical protein